MISFEELNLSKNVTSKVEFHPQYVNSRGILELSMEEKDGVEVICELHRSYFLNHKKANSIGIYVDVIGMTKITLVNNSEGNISIHDSGHKDTEELASFIEGLVANTDTEFIILGEETNEGRVRIISNKQEPLENFLSNNIDTL